MIGFLAVGLIGACDSEQPEIDETVQEILDGQILLDGVSASSSFTQTCSMFITLRDQIEAR